MRRLKAFRAAFALIVVPGLLCAVPNAAAQTWQHGDESDDQSIWFGGGEPTVATQRLLALVSSAGLDGLDPAAYAPDRLREAIAAAAGTGSPRDVERAASLLTRTLVAYVRDLHNFQDVGMTYVDAGLAPRQPSAKAILRRARAGDQIDQLLMMHPLYLQLRDGYAAWLQRRDNLPEATRRRQEERIRLNLERARVLPSGPGAQIIVDAASQQLLVYDRGRLLDTMKVIVGKPTEPTPMMAALVRYAVVNPYWNVPPDLVAKRIAPNVLSQGMPYLSAKGYQVLSDWSEDPAPVAPATVDWKAVAAGAQELPMRQLPGPANMMGAMKFMFPNKFGVYLHDTPDKSLFGDADRRKSSGCVRLEDAGRLARWLFGEVPSAPASAAEVHVPLARPVPVYIIYLTAVGENGDIAFRDDLYGRDRPAGGRIAATR